MRLILGLAHVLPCAHYAASSPYFGGFRDVGDGAEMGGHVRTPTFGRPMTHGSSSHLGQNFDGFGTGVNPTRRLSRVPPGGVLRGQGTTINGKQLDAAQKALLNDFNVPIDKKIAILQPAAANIDYACKAYQEAMAQHRIADANVYLYDAHDWLDLLTGKASEFHIWPNHDPEQYKLASSALDGLREVATQQALPPELAAKVHDEQQQLEAVFRSAQQNSDRAGLHKDFGPLTAVANPLKPAPVRLVPKPNLVNSGRGRPPPLSDFAVWPEDLKVLNDPNAPLDQKIKIIDSAPQNIESLHMLYMQTKGGEAKGYMHDAFEWVDLLKQKASGFKAFPDPDDVNQYKLASAALKGLRQLSNQVRFPSDITTRVNSVLPKYEASFLKAQQEARRMDVHKDFDDLSAMGTTSRPGPGNIDQGTLPSHLGFPGSPRTPVKSPTYFDNVFNTNDPKFFDEHSQLGARLVGDIGEQKWGDVKTLTSVLAKLDQHVPRDTPRRGFFLEQLKTLDGMEGNDFTGELNSLYSVTYEHMEMYANEYLLLDAIIIAKATDKSSKYYLSLKAVYDNLTKQILNMVQGEAMSHDLVVALVKRLNRAYHGAN